MLTRRRFLQGCSAAAGSVLAGRAFAKAPAQLRERPPNFLFVHTDQQPLDSLSAYGCRFANTPNMDRLAARGTSFMESHCANPVCVPARTSWYTGRFASEHGVMFNDLPFRRTDLPDMGQWFSKEGYDCVYVGKWHIKRDIRQSFQVIHQGHGMGEHGDSASARAAQAFLRHRRGDTPFFLNVGLLQPHDICFWLWQHGQDPGRLEVPEIEDDLPPLPPSFKSDPLDMARYREEKHLYQPGVYDTWTERQWRYYIWSYYRHVEMVDGQIGRILDALEDSGLEENTILVFSSDHGEARGRHKIVTKNTLYEEVVKVPLIVSCPGRIREGYRDRHSLVSGVDVFPTLCDYAGVKPPERLGGRSLRPLLEERPTEWREYVAADSWLVWMIRTARYKYLWGQKEELYDLERDPWEMTNLAESAGHADVLEDHRKRLDDWMASIEMLPELRQLRTDETRVGGLRAAAAKGEAQ